MNADTINLGNTTITELESGGGIQNKPQVRVEEPGEEKKEGTIPFPEIKVTIDSKEIEKVVLPVLQQIAVEAETLKRKAEAMKRLGVELPKSQQASLERYTSVINRALGDELPKNSDFKPWVTSDQINARVDFLSDQINARVDLLYGNAAETVKSLVQQVETLLEGIDLANLEQLAINDSKLVAIRQELEEFAMKTNQTWEMVALNAGASSEAVEALRNAGKSIEIKTPLGEKM